MFSSGISACSVRVGTVTKGIYTYRECMGSMLGAAESSGAAT